VGDKKHWEVRGGGKHSDVSYDRWIMLNWSKTVYLWSIRSYLSAFLSHKIWGWWSGCS